VQHADALWDAIATPGPHRPTYVEQHKQVCRAVARILEELTPDEEPTTDRAAVLREAAELLDRRATGIDAFASSDHGEEARAVRELVDAAAELRRMADGAQPEATAEHHTVDGIRYLCHSGDHYCPPADEAQPAQPAGETAGGGV
jgi:acyl-CoA reductase-like NAD-dependent aldehyde dehydrogenase